MSDLRITELTALTAADLDSLDVLPAVDISASATRKLTVKDLVEKGVTLIADDTVPGKKLLFNADGTDVIPTAGIADDAITTAKIADDAITAAQLANESTVDLVTEKPLSGAFTGQFALDIDDNKLYCWDGTAWQDVAAPGSINTVEGDTAGIVDIVVTKLLIRSRLPPASTIRVLQTSFSQVQPAVLVQLLIGRLMVLTCLLQLQVQKVV